MINISLSFTFITLIIINLLQFHKDSIRYSIQSGMNTNDPNSFYTTVPPLRHIHPYPFNENLSINQSDQLKLPINQYNNNNNNMIIQQNDLIKHLQLLNKNQFIYGSNVLNTLTTPLSSAYTDNLTATLTLQQWIEYMSKPELIKNNNNNNMKFILNVTYLPYTIKLTFKI